MFCIVWCFAKSPISDSCLAWKISGPGITRQFYNHIEISDAMTIIHAQLEKYELVKFKNTINTYLEEPYKKNANKILKYFSPLDLKFTPTSELLDSIKYYKDKVLQQIYDRIRLFPKVNNVKFTNVELSTLIIASREYIRDYVISHNMDYLFEYNNIPKNSWGKLNEIILVNAFGDQVLESLTDMDYKVEIHRSENLEFDGIKFKILNNEKISIIKDKKLTQTNYNNIELRNIELKEIYQPGNNRFLFLNIELINDIQRQNSILSNILVDYERNKEEKENQNDHSNLNRNPSSIQQEER